MGLLLLYGGTDALEKSRLEALLAMERGTVKIPEVKLVYPGACGFKAESEIR